jgi:hypothetical protein
MEDIFQARLERNPRPLHEPPGFGTLAHSPGAAVVGFIVVVSSKL